MCQFVNGINVYGSKIVAHTIIKSLIIFGNSMPWKKKENASGHQGLGLRSQKKILDNEYPRIYTNIFLQ
jgi:hypothetical protein